MELIFPDNPTIGQVFLRWIWDGEKWVSSGMTGWAPLMSPNFTGIPTAPTAPPGTSTSQIATTAFVMQAITSHIAGVASFNNRTGNVTFEASDITGVGGALLDSPHFINNPTAPTPPAGDNSDRLATTEYVDRAIAADQANSVLSWNGRVGNVVLTLGDITNAGGAPIASPEFTGNPNAPTPPATSNDTSLATTAYVTSAVAASQAFLQNEINNSVRSFNGRTGAVTLVGNDLLAAGGALLWSPAFQGAPTAPTPVPASDSSTRLATTAFVQAAIQANLPEAGPPGPQGPQGRPGPGFQILPSVPSAAALPPSGNQPGDVRIAQDTGIGYVWEVPPGMWSAIGYMVGLTGATGPQGAPGGTGPVGPGLVAKGTVATFADLSTITGQQPGDMYTALDTGNGYVWEPPSWVNLGPIRGPQGPGSLTTFSATPPPNPDVGDYWINTSTTPPTFSVWNGTSWQVVVPTLKMSTQVFNASDVYTPPAGLQWAIVECWGAGGGGGAITNLGAAQIGGGGGGGQGGYSRGVFSAAQIGASVNMTVGAGGSGIDTGGGTGGNGGSTSFGSLLTAIGGNGGVTFISPLVNRVGNPGNGGGGTILNGLAGRNATVLPWQPAGSWLVFPGVGGGNSNATPAPLPPGSSSPGTLATSDTAGGNGGISNADTTTPTGTFIQGGAGGAGQIVVTEFSF